MDISFVPVAINSISQILYIAFVLPPRTKENNLTHWNAKTFGGIGQLCTPVLPLTLSARAPC